MFTIGSSSPFAQLASAGVFSAAMMPSPRQPLRSSTDSASDSGAVMYVQLQPCSERIPQDAVDQLFLVGPAGEGQGDFFGLFHAESCIVRKR